MQPLLRRTARVLPVCQGRVLLLFGHDPARPDEPYWFTIGGGAEPGETLEVAALRELREETGVVATVDQLIGPVHRGSHEYSYDGVLYRSEGTFFAVALGEIEVSFDGLDADERDHITEAQWWLPDDLEGAPLSNPGLPTIARLAVDAATS